MVRSESLRVDPGDRTHRIFRPSDLIHGEVLGKGSFGQAVKVPQLLFSITVSLPFFMCQISRNISNSMPGWHVCAKNDFNWPSCFCQGNPSGDRGGDGDERVDKF